MTAEEVVAAARECLGTPFRHQGRVLGLALDCAGVVAHAVKACGLDVAEVHGYGPTPNKGMLERALNEQPALLKVGVSDRVAGDILLMRFAEEPQHLAVLAGETIIHAYEAAGKCCEHRLSSMWAARIAGVYRVRGL